MFFIQNRFAFSYSEVHYGGSIITRLIHINNGANVEWMNVYMKVQNKTVNIQFLFKALFHRPINIDYKCHKG